MSSAISTSDPVETYLTGLNRALVGPRRRKADLLAEARDSLVDATEAFEADGLSVDEAKLRAVEDFGDLTEVVPGYRAELGIAQGRRTAVLLFLVLIAQPIVWMQGVWAWTQQPEAPNAFVAFLNQALELIGGLSIAGAVLAVVATGIGLRYPLVRDRATRATAVFALVSCAAVGAMAVGMSLFSNEMHGSDIAGLSVVGGFVLLPLAFVMHSAHRCLRLA